LNLLLTGSWFAVRSVLAIGDRLPALIGLVSLAALAEVKKGDTKPPMGGQLDPKKDLADDDRAAVLGLAVPGSQLADTKDQVSVDVELVIAVDVSYSMDIRELAVQREGYAQAIVSKEFLQALTTGPNTKLAVTYFEWSASQKIIIPWRVIDGPETADAVAREIMKTPVRQGSSTQSPARSVSRCRCSTKIPIAACGALSIFLATDLITTARPSPVRVTRRSKEASPSTAYRS
jgi:hypothetical protein